MDTHPQHTDPSAEKTHESTSDVLGRTPACSTASFTIKPGDPVYKDMTFDGPQTAIATIGGRLKVRGQDVLITAAHPITDRLTYARRTDREEEVYLGTLLLEGSLHYYSPLNERPELDYALIRPGPDVHMADNVELVPSPWDSVQLPAFTSEEEFSNVRNISVRAVTASAGEVVGKIDTIPCFLVIPGSSALQKVYEVEFSVPIALGDSGAWVFDASNGSLLGHIVAGIPGDGVDLVVPAYQVFADLATVMSPGLA
jgi:hypothetical protein